MDERFRCPACRAEDEVTGAREGEDIRLTCGVCGASWIRDSPPRCATCGSVDVVFRPRTLSASSPAMQMAMPGLQNVPLCVSCDWEAMDKAAISGNPVAADYVPAAMKARPEEGPRQ